MSAPNPHQREVADELLRKFPKSPTKALARIAYRDNPELWSTLEVARQYFRKRRGNSGVQSRKQTTDKTYFRKPGSAIEDTFKRMPKPISHFEEWGSINFEGPFTALILSDLQIPYYDKTATVCALKYGQKLEADMVLLNGDIVDFYAISRWETDPRKRDFPQELRDTRDFLGVVRGLFPKAQIIYKLGNHEERLLRYMWVKAPELLGVAEFEIEEILKFADYDIQLVKDNRPIKLGELNVIHGHEFKFNISNPVNPARGLFLRGKSHATCGHFHQSSSHSERSLEQRVISTWSTGCLCDLHPYFRPLNNWNHGFMVAQISKDGEFEVGNLRIVHGKAYY